MPNDTTETPLETPSDEGVSDSTPQAPVVENPLVTLTYVGPLDDARVLGITFPKGVPVWVDVPTANYIEERHALDACFVKE